MGALQAHVVSAKAFLGFRLSGHFKGHKVNLIAIKFSKSKNFALFIKSKKWKKLLEG